MAKREALRVAVGTPNAIYSSPWRYWTTGDDIYAAARNTIGIYKLSLHASGRWRLAVSRARVNNPFNADDGRLIARGQRPSEWRPGWTHAFDLCVPGVYVQRRFDVSMFARSSDMTWVRPPSVGWKVILTLLVADSADRRVEEAIRPTDQVVGRVLTGSDRAAWLVRRHKRMDRFEFEHLQVVVGDMRVTFPQSLDDFRAAVTTVEIEHPHPRLVNAAAGWENLRDDG